MIEERPHNVPTSGCDCADCREHRFHTWGVTR